MRKFLELALRANDWNEKNLPLNTEEMQWSKIQEETNEVLDAIDKNDLNQKKLEIADVFIAVSGLIRFDITAYFNKIDILFCMIDDEEYPIDEFMNNIENKLNIIEKRKYTIKDGVYKHITLN